MLAPEVATNGPIPALDGLRGLASLMVLTTHVAFATGLVTHPWLGPLTGRLDFGVCLFYFLSGFLLYRPWAMAALVGRPGPQTRRYLRKRFARIYPAYVLLLIFVLGLYPPVAVAPASTWWSYLTLTHIYHEGDVVPGLTQIWSLATEVAFYLILPLLAWAAGSRHRGDPDRSARRQFAVLVAMALMTVAFLAVRAWTTWLPDWLSSFWLPGFLDWFALGMALAVVQARLQLHPHAPAPAPYLRLRAMSADLGTCLVVAGLCYLIACTPISGRIYFDGGASPDPAGPWSLYAKHYLYAGCALFLMLPLVLGPRSTGYARALSSPAMRMLGLVSYGVFLWHLILISILSDALGLQVFGGGFWILWPCTVAATLAVAALSWLLVEKPVLRWAHRR